MTSNNTDKHRLIPVSVVVGEVLRARDSADDMTYADLFSVVNGGPLRDGQELLRMPASMADSHVRAEITSTVGFQDIQADEVGCPASMAGALWRMATRVAEIIETFRPAF